MKLGVILAALASLLLADAASAADITMLASGATKDVLLELLPAFEKNSGHTLVTTWSGTANIKTRIAAGEVYDLVIVGGPEIDAFIQQGTLVPGSRVDLMKSGVGVAVRAGAPKPDISSSDAVKTAVLAATTIGYSTGPSGVHMASLFARMGIADQITSRLRQVPSGVNVGTIIARGDAEIGFQQVSEFIHFPGIDYVGPLPAAVQQITVYAAGIFRGATQPEAAKAFVQFLASPAATPVIHHHGMEPG